MKKLIATVLSGVLLAAALLGAPVGAFASSGVSVNTGKIVLDKPVVADGTYDLPNIQVTDSGTEASDYEISVAYNQVQSEQKPDASWFHFNPATFHLATGESKIVKTSMSVPSKVAAGDYFVYLQARAISKDGAPGQTISGAAATKLYFSVEDTNLFVRGWYGLRSVVHDTAPWSHIVLWILAVVILYFLLKNILMLSKERSPNTTQD